MTTTRAVVVGLLAAALGSPSVALAQEGGVTLDKGSPSGQEYSLPLDTARGTSTGGAQKKHGAREGKKTSTGSTTPLFGEGVTTATKPAAPATQAPATRKKAKRSSKRSKPAKRSKRSKPASTATTPSAASSGSGGSAPPPAQASADSGSSSAPIAMIGGALIVLVLGVSGGLALRRRRSVA